MNDNEKVYEYVIPDNILESKRFLGFRRRNWIEGIIWVLLLGFIIYLVPFVTRVKIIFMVCICGSILLINLIGVKDQSLFEMVQNFIIARANSGNYHLRRPNCEKRIKSGRVAQSYSRQNNGTSAADRIAEIVKSKYKEFKEQYRS